MTISLPQNIALGSLEVFRDEINTCFDDCVKGLQQQSDASSALAFLPLLLNKVFEISRMPLATILNKANNQNISHEDAKKEIGSKYPVLAEKIVIASNNWSGNTNNILQRWQKDKNQIAQTFFDTDNIGHIISIGSNQGDEHENGQQTLVIELSCGRKIAYKPRNLELEKSFYLFSSQLGFKELYNPKYLSRDDYGWMEYIPHKECQDATQVADYYYQAGLLLSLLYALEAEDIHHENMIAYGAHPVLIDLETLFHHRDDSTTNQHGDQQHLQLGNHTVLKTHFIPQYLKLDAEKELAAIFPVFANDTPLRNSMPRLKQQPVPVNNHVNDFLNGFKTGYRRLIRNRSALLNANGPLTLFSGCSARYICRPTQVYSRLIQASYHPKYLQCFDEQSSLFKKLRLDLAGRKFLGVLVDTEEGQLSRAEIPLFTHLLDEKNVLKGGEIIGENYFSMTGLELAQHKIRHMNEQDLAGQIKLIEHSFKLSNPKPSIERPNIVIKANMDFQQRSEAGAYSIGQFLLQQSIQHQDGRIWPLFKFDGVESTCLDPTNSSLYNGYLGIQLFLAYLQHRFPKLCGKQEIINQTKAQISMAIQSFSEHHGCGFSGLGGLFYALSQFANLWPEEKWTKNQGHEILNLMQDLPSKDDKLDIIGGSAGAIISLISYFKQSGEQQALDIAGDFAENLLNHFNDKGQVGWQTNGGNVLSGFAHGNAGIAYALMKLALLRPNKQYTHCALAAMEFESNEYSQDIGNWPDKRFDTDDEQKKQAMTAWCHGALGIGMSRLSLKKDIKTPLPDFFNRDIDRALAHLSKRPIVKNEGLCHGNFGNFELLIMAKQQGGLNAEEQHQAQLMIAEQIEMIANKGMTQKNERAFMSLSLMNGWAGIGYQLLRFSQPEEIPSILLLDS